MTLHLPDVADPTLPTRWCLFDGQQVWLDAGAFPAQRPAHSSNPHFIGHNGQFNLFSAELIGAAPPQWQAHTLRQALQGLPADAVPLLARAAQLRRFEHSHRFCGACAQPLQAHQHDHGRGCPSCGELYYPRLSPAMMVAVTRGREILLARGPHFSPGMYSALAGFVEPGETLEACVERETAEEVGIRIRQLQYVGSQSWPFPHSLMLAFTAEYAAGEITPQPGEIEAADWFDIDHLPPTPAGHSIAHWLIKHTVEQLRRREH